MVSIGGLPGPRSLYLLLVAVNGASVERFSDLGDYHILPIRSTVGAICA